MNKKRMFENDGYAVVVSAKTGNEAGVLYSITLNLRGVDFPFTTVLVPYMTESKRPRLMTELEKQAVFYNAMIEGLFKFKEKASSPEIKENVTWLTLQAIEGFKRYHV